MLGTRGRLRSAAGRLASFRLPGRDAGADGVFAVSPGDIFNQAAFSNRNYHLAHLGMHPTGKRAVVRDEVPPARPRVAVELRQLYAAAILSGHFRHRKRLAQQPLHIRSRTLADLDGLYRAPVDRPTHRSATRQQHH